MFIKKDLRKIEEILNDPADSRERMILPKRSSEFSGNVKILCKENNAKKIANLKVLNLYENELTSLKGIGVLANTPIEDINLGYNKLTNIPVEFGSLGTLKTLWLDDNMLDQFPTCLCSLTGLEMLRLTGNQLRSVPMSVSALTSLVTLALDNNSIVEFPQGCLKLPKLEHLWLRQNRIRSLPDNIDEMKVLKTLSISSNSLQSLPDCIAQLDSLENLYVNGNQIDQVSASICTIPNLKELNLANNSIIAIPQEWNDMWGQLDAEKATFVGVDQPPQCRVTLVGNPLD